MDPRYQHIFVIRAIEYPYPAALGKYARAAPEVIVSQLVAGRRLKAMNAYALSVYAAHHVFDRAVLTGRVHALQDDEKTVAFLRA